MRKQRKYRAVFQKGLTRVGLDFYGSDGKPLAVEHAKYVAAVERLTLLKVTQLPPDAYMDPGLFYPVPKEVRL